MIISFSFENFFSFLERTEVSFLAGKQDPDTAHYTTTDTGLRLSKMMSVIGANGSGKTNILRAYNFLMHVMRDSFKFNPDQELPLDQFLFTGEPRQETSFSLLFELDKFLYRYELSLTKKQIVNEVLSVKTESNFRYLFKRTLDKESGTYTVREQDFGKKVETIASGILNSRRNATLFSGLIFANYEPIKPIADYLLGHTTNVGRMGVIALPFLTNPEMVASQCMASPEIRTAIESLMARIDLGISGIDIREVRFPEEAKKQMNADKFYTPFAKHTVNGTEYTLHFSMESGGTQSLFVLLYHILTALSRPGIAVMDELEASLHPHMIPAILDLFISPESNPHNTQLLFTSHSLEVLNHLDKNQIVLVEKNPETLMSEAWRLDEMTGVRRDDNLYAKYMAGRYGAVPRL